MRRLTQAWRVTDGGVFGTALRFGNATEDVLAKAHGCKGGKYGNLRTRPFHWCYSETLCEVLADNTDFSH
jgi:hypothetical protein